MTMPKSSLEALTDKMGYKEGPAKPAAPAGKDAAAPAPAPGEKGAITQALESFEEGSQARNTGMMRAVAGVVTGIPRAANAGIGYFKPGWAKTLGDVAERVPGVKRMEEFAAEESKDRNESIGYGLGQIGMLGLGRLGAAASTARAAAPAAARAAPRAVNLPGAFVPQYGFMATGAAPRAVAAGGAAVPRTMRLPGTFTAGRGFVPPAPPAAAPAAAPAARSSVLGRIATQTAKNAATGAAAGASTDPQSPGTGALAGAAGGVVPGLLGQFMRSRAGQYMASVGLGGALGYHLYHSIRREGFSEHTIPKIVEDTIFFSLLRHHGSPIRRAVDRWLASGAGRAGGVIRGADPALTGGAAGAAAGKLPGLSRGHPQEPIAVESEPDEPLVDPMEEDRPLAEE
jgi:hypothetical protein